jgi:hypothetical protein
MGENGNHPGVRAVEVRKRARGSGPILLLAGLFVVATFLAWYFSWFGRELSDADVSKYLADEKNPRHVQHALNQIQNRMERGDAGSKNWYPQLIALSGSPETEFRLTVAWLMGFDNSVPQFHEALLKLVKDPEPLVRRNAALALVRFNDTTGHQEIVSILESYAVTAPANGVVASSLQEGAKVARTTLLARIQKVLIANGAQVTQGEHVLSLISDENSVWEALRGLALVGSYEDVPVIQTYVHSNDVSAKLREQAKNTVNAIETRTRHLGNKE